MEISLCMIVKNEEKHLAKCLDNVKDYIDEIVIVDTGSTDNTKEIAKRYTDRIYDFVWCDDFARARNFSLSKAINDWVLVLDADEFVSKFNKKVINRFINSNHKVVGRLKRINPFEDEKKIKRYIERVNRLFNKIYFHYEGIIHEQIVSKDYSQYDTQPIEIEVEHIGYMDEVVTNTKKLERNINLLKNALENTPQDPYLHYQIGKSYYMAQEYDMACESFTKAIDSRSDFRYEYTEDLVESYGYALLKCERYTEAMELKKYQTYYEKSPDYNFVMGLIYMNNARFQDAISYFEKCIGQKEGKIEGINSYQPNYNIGVIYETLGFEEKAIEFYQQCGDYLSAKQRIEKIMNEQDKKDKVLEPDSKQYIKIKTSIQKNIENGNLEEAKILLEQGFKIIGNDIELYSMKSVIEMIENRLEEAEKTLKSALNINDKNFDILYNLGYLYEIGQRNQLALDFYSQALKFVESAEMKNELEEKIKNIKNNTHKTSIIILTYNNLDYNKICIESIKKYTQKSTYEIIVVDNHSTDGTVEWLNTQEDLIVIYNKENLGFPRGCNQGIEIAQGDEILLLNNDTIVTARWLENLRECLYSSEAIGAVGPVTNSCPNYQTIPTNYTNVEEMLQFAEKHNISNPVQWEEKLRLIGYCMLIKKEVIDKSGLLDERFTPGNFEDDDFSLRIRKEKYKLMLCKDTFIHHFGSTSFNQNNKKYIELLKLNSDKFQKKWGIDPFTIIDIEKEVADLIISNAIPDMNVLHIGCAGGATLLKLKNDIPSCNLYGVENDQEVIINTEHFSKIIVGGLEKLYIFSKRFFDYIIITNPTTDINGIGQSVLKAKEYLKLHGEMFVSLPLNLKKDKKYEHQLRRILGELKLKYRIIKKKDKTTIALKNEIVQENSKLPLVSILIPAYNRPEYLKLALESVLEQTYKNIEIIIGDDSTTPEVEEMIQEYLNEYDNISYFRNEKNLGQFDNDIKLFKLAKGEYINYLMDDDLFEKTKIEKMMRYYLQDIKNEIKLVTSSRKLIDDNGLILKDQEINKCLFDQDTIVNGVTLGDFILKLNYNCVGEPTTVLFRKADLTETFGTFDGRRYGCNVDIATWLNLLSKGKAVYIAEPLSCFRIHSGQQLQSPKMKLLGAIDYGYEILSGYKKGFLQKSGDLKKATKFALKYIFSTIEHLKSEKINQEDFQKLKELPSKLMELLNGNDINEYHKKLKFILRRVEQFDDVDSLSILKDYLVSGKLNETDIIYIVFRDIIQKEFVIQVIASWLFEEGIQDISIKLFGFACDINLNNPNNLYNYIQVLNKTNRKEAALDFLNQNIGHTELVKELKEQIMEG